MADITLLQKGDLNSGHFTNDNTNAKGGVKVRYSSAPGNLLQQRDDGLYYGAYAPDDKRYQYVDAANGNDANVGSKAAPLKTLKAALDRLVQGTEDNYIYLHEQQVHTIDSAQRHLLTASVTISAYGAQLDALEARWNSANTGWDVKASDGWKPLMPTLKVVAGFDIPPFGGEKSPNWIEIADNKTLIIDGLNYQVEGIVKTPRVKVVEWGATIIGRGDLEFRDSVINNATSGKGWFLAGTNGASLRVLLRGTEFGSLDAANAMFHAESSPLSVWATTRNARPHSSGLNWRAAPSAAQVKALLVNPGVDNPVAANITINP